MRFPLLPKGIFVFGVASSLEGSVIFSWGVGSSRWTFKRTFEGFWQAMLHVRACGANRPGSLNPKL